MVEEEGTRAIPPGGLDRPALRHDPVHRLGGDVLRRLVLDLLRDGAVPSRARPFSPVDEVRQRLEDLAARRESRPVPAFELPLVNTLTLLLSGTTVTWAHHALQTGDRRGAKIGLLLTILLGVLFTSIQAYEYHHILTDHLFYGPGGIRTPGLYGSAFFMATGFHGFHVLIGTIFLTVCLIRLMNGGFSPKQHFGFEAAAWYWHFVDVVWLFLFTFLYVIFGAGWGH